MLEKIGHVKQNDNAGVDSIVIKPHSGIDLIKRPDPRFYRSTRVNPKKLKKIKILIFHMKKSM
jgi:hypothetical protein